MTHIKWWPSAAARFSALAFVVTVAASNLAMADVTLSERVNIEGTGVLSMANMSGTTTTTISGDKARMESDLQMQSRMVRMFARMGPTADIVRLDQDKVLQLDLKKKQYSEFTFEQRRAQMQAAMEQSHKAQPPVAGVNESDCEWTDPKADVKRTGERSNIAGMSAERVTITASQGCRDKKTGSVCEFGLLLDEWISPEFIGGDTARKFYTAYGQKMGLDAAFARDGAQRAETLFKRYKGIWSEVATKMKDVKGYPIKSSFALAVGGPQCQSTQQSTQTAQNGGDSSTPSSSPAPTDAAGVANKIVGSIFNRKRAAQQAQTDQSAAAQPAMTVNGMVPLLTVTSELISVSQDAAPPSAFEPPADFKKVRAKTRHPERRSTRRQRSGWPPRADHDRMRFTSAGSRPSDSRKSW